MGLTAVSSGAGESLYPAAYISSPGTFTGLCGGRGTNVSQASLCADWSSHGAHSLLASSLSGRGVWSGVRESGGLPKGKMALGR